MTVLAGSVIATYAVTGSVGVPLSFIVLGIALWPFTVAYTAMSRHVSHAGVFYAFMANGLSRTVGVAGGAISLLAYNSIQICLYGLFGASMQSFWPSAHLPWWGWAIVAWLFIGTLGLLHIRLNAKVLAITLGVEVVMIVLFDIAALLHPAGGHVQLGGLALHNLFAGGIGGVFAFGIAAFVGYESGLAYGEEAQGTKAVGRATFIALFVLAALYAFSSLALSITEGPKHVIDASRDPSSGIPFSIISAHYGSGVAWLANLLLVTSILGAMLSFHNTAARYTFALGRERVLPRAFANIGSGRTAGSPVAGSVFQSILAFVVFVAFAIGGLDPITTLFTWLSALAALAIVLLMLLTSLAVAGYFRRNPSEANGESGWARWGAPYVGALLLTGVLVTMVANLSSVLGSSSSVLGIAIPGIVVVTALLGVIWGRSIRMTNPDAYHQIGVGESVPLAHPTPAFADHNL
jgi:amino acid transporter